MRIGVNPRIGESTRDGLAELRVAFGELVLRDLECFSSALDGDGFRPYVIGMPLQQGGIHVRKGDVGELIREQVDHCTMLGANRIVDGDFAFGWDENNACG